VRQPCHLEVVTPVGQVDRQVGLTVDVYVDRPTQQAIERLRLSELHRKIV
jgi:hypothetical protein